MKTTIIGVNALHLVHFSSIISQGKHTVVVYLVLKIFSPYITIVFAHCYHYALPLISYSTLFTFHYQVRSQDFWFGGGG